MYIDLYDSNGALVTRLTEKIPSFGWTPDVFENLSFESVNPGGFSVANFTIHRTITEYWADLAYGNEVVIGNGPDIYWEGYIDKPSRSINPDKIDVGCLGWNTDLNQLWIEFDINGPYKCSTLVDFIAHWSGIYPGVIETTDFEFPAGTIFEFTPATYMFNCIEEMNAANNWDWGVWDNRAINYTAKTPNIVHWVAYARDCDDLVISPNPEQLSNAIMVNFTQGAGVYEQVEVSDADSIALYGYRRKLVDIPGQVDEDSVGPADPGGATQIANTYLAEHKDLKIAAEFTLNRVYDIYGVEHHLGEVRAGQNIRLGDYLTTEELLNGVNNITVFQIKSPRYDHDSYTLDVTPTEFVSSTEITLSRLQTVGY